MKPCYPEVGQSTKNYRKDFQLYTFECCWPLHAYITFIVGKSTQFPFYKTKVVFLDHLPSILSFCNYKTYLRFSSASEIISYNFSHNELRQGSDILRSYNTGEIDWQLIKKILHKAGSKQGKGQIEKGHRAFPLTSSLDQWSPTFWHQGTISQKTILPLTREVGE